jgi:hypothetical protein
MKKIKKMIGMGLMLCLLLSGCGGSQPSSNDAQDVTTSPAAEVETTAETKTVMLYTNTDDGALSENVYEYTGELTADVLGEGLTELTGLYYTFTSTVNGNDLYIDWSMEPGLLSDGDAEKMFTFFGDAFPDFGTQQWFMMDSLWYTLINNLNVENVYYTMDGGQELIIEGFDELFQIELCSLDVPYLGSEFYFSHEDGKGEDWSSSPQAWEGICGSFVREGSDQYNNASLQMKSLSNGCVLFEFDLMEGSESKETQTLLLPFILIVDEDGVGHYESDPDIENPLYIDFYLSEDGQHVSVTHSGEAWISPDGMYEFVDEGLEVSVFAGVEVLNNLPTAATSLNSNTGEYTIDYSEDLVDNLYYQVEANFTNNGAVLAKFLIATDLSAIYRVDDDIDPIQIFGLE